MRRADVEITLGQTFGKLTVVGAERSVADGKSSRLAVPCRCACGTERLVRRDCLLRGDVRSCGCQNKRISEAPGLAARNALRYQYGRNARQRGYVFELTEEEFAALTVGRCFYCGSAPTQVFRRPGTQGDIRYNGIDRIDNSRGYIHDNCVSCCGPCNKAKGTMSHEEFVAWLDRLVAYRSRL